MGRPLSIELPAEPLDYQARLLRTLGVEWTVAVNARPAVLPDANGRPVVLRAWCPRCRDEVMPHDTTGRCLWCDGPTEPARDTPGERRDDMATQLETLCKIEGCPDEAAAARGRYAGLCVRHRDEAAAEAGAGGGNRSTTPGDSIVERVRALVPAARKVDKARAQMAKLGDAGDAREEFEAALRSVQTTPTAANLERLERATKQLRNGQPKRDKLQGELGEAESEFKAALVAVAAKVR